jgi:hypothetical protein
MALFNLFRSKVKNGNSENDNTVNVLFQSTKDKVIAFQGKSMLYDYLETITILFAIDHKQKDFKISSTSDGKYKMPIDLEEKFGNLSIYEKSNGNIYILDSIANSKKYGRFIGKPSLSYYYIICVQIMKGEIKI